MPASTPAPATLGAEIRRVRESLDLTLMQFEELTGIPWQTLAKYETDRVVPPADKLLSIVHATRRAPRPFRVERVARAVAAELAEEKAAA